MIAFILTCGLCALICYMIEKDRRPEKALTSALWGVALGPIGVIVVLVQGGNKA